jgi:hypothetical protein
MEGGCGLGFGGTFIRSFSVTLVVGSCRCVDALVCRCVGVSV